MVGFYARLGELTLYVRQLGWLHATPKDKTGKPQPSSRLQAIQTRGEQPSLPHNPAPYLTAWLFDVGPGASGGMSEGQLSYRDLQAWQEVTGIELAPWEAKTLRTLSSEYLIERQKAEELDRPAPYLGEQDEIAANRKRVAQQVKSAFAGLRGKVAKPSASE